MGPVSIYYWQSDALTLSLDKEAALCLSALTSSEVNRRFAGVQLQNLRPAET